eukprot:TRINITY_DN50283_c0_g1_i4.p1 TRINITY_DN50283_c0_g1~~TRINITY_DN50283_c0_g1_i4.p1  ORF type:complete len:2011 (-),score=416.53 TRINITY_DN50283_c0_g1_i4:63-6095(-)
MEFARAIGAVGASLHAPPRLRPPPAPLDSISPREPRSIAKPPHRNIQGATASAPSLLQVPGAPHRPMVAAAQSPARTKLPRLVAGQSSPHAAAVSRQTPSGQMRIAASEPHLRGVPDYNAFAVQHAITEVKELLTQPSRAGGAGPANRRLPVVERLPPLGMVAPAPLSGNSPSAPSRPRREAEDPEKAKLNVAVTRERRRQHARLESQFEQARLMSERLHMLKQLRESGDAAGALEAAQSAAKPQIAHDAAQRPSLPTTVRHSNERPAGQEPAIKSKRKKRWRRRNAAAFSAGHAGKGKVKGKGSESVDADTAEEEDKEEGEISGSDEEEDRAAAGGNLHAVQEDGHCADIYAESMSVLRKGPATRRSVEADQRAAERRPDDMPDAFPVVRRGHNGLRKELKNAKSTAGDSDMERSPRAHVRQSPTDYEVKAQKEVQLAPAEAADGQQQDALSERKPARREPKVVRPSEALEEAKQLLAQGAEAFEDLSRPPWARRDPVPACEEKESAEDRPIALSSTAAAAHNSTQDRNAEWAQLAEEEERRQLRRLHQVAEGADPAQSGLKLLDGPHGNAAAQEPAFELHYMSFLGAPGKRQDAVRLAQEAGSTLERYLQKELILPQDAPEVSQSGIPLIGFVSGGEPSQEARGVKPAAAKTELERYLEKSGVSQQLPISLAKPEKEVAVHAERDDVVSSQHQAVPMKQTSLEEYLAERSEAHTKPLPEEAACADPPANVEAVLPAASSAPSPTGAAAAAAVRRLQSDSGLPVLVYANGSKLGRPAKMRLPAEGRLLTVSAIQRGAGSPSKAAAVQAQADLEKSPRCVLRAMEGCHRVWSVGSAADVANVPLEVAAAADSFAAIIQEDGAVGIRFTSALVCNTVLAHIEDILASCHKREAEDHQVVLQGPHEKDEDEPTDQSQEVEEDEDQDEAAESAAGSPAAVQPGHQQCVTPGDDATPFAQPSAERHHREETAAASAGQMAERADNMKTKQEGSAATAGRAGTFTLFGDATALDSQDVRASSRQSPLDKSVKSFCEAAQHVTSVPLLDDEFGLCDLAYPADLLHEALGSSELDRLHNAAACSEEGASKRLTLECLTGALLKQPQEDSSSVPDSSQGPFLQRPQPVYNGDAVREVERALQEGDMSPSNFELPIFAGWPVVGSRSVLGADLPTPRPELRDVVPESMQLFNGTCEASLVDGSVIAAVGADDAVSAHQQAAGNEPALDKNTHGDQDSSAARSDLGASLVRPVAAQWRSEGAATSADSAGAPQNAFSEAEDVAPKVETGVDNIVLARTVSKEGGGSGDDIAAPPNPTASERDNPAWDMLPDPSPASPRAAQALAGVGKRPEDLCKDPARMVGPIVAEIDCLGDGYATLVEPCLASGPFERSISSARAKSSSGETQQVINASVVTRQSALRAPCSNAAGMPDEKESQASKQSLIAELLQEAVEQLNEPETAELVGMLAAKNSVTLEGFAATMASMGFSLWDGSEVAEAVSRLKQVTFGMDQSIIIRALKILVKAGRAGDEEALMAVMSVLDSRDANVRIHAARAVFRLTRGIEEDFAVESRRAAFNELFRSSRLEDSEEVRSAALEALVRTQDEPDDRVVLLATDLLQDGSELVRRTAEGCLTRIAADDYWLCARVLAESEVTSPTRAARENARLALRMLDETLEAAPSTEIVAPPSVTLPAEKPSGGMEAGQPAAPAEELDSLDARARQITLEYKTERRLEKVDAARRQIRVGLASLDQHAVKAEESAKTAGAARLSPGVERTSASLESPDHQAHAAAAGCPAGAEPGAAPAACVNIAHSPSSPRVLACEVADDCSLEVHDSVESNYAADSAVLIATAAAGMRSPSRSAAVDQLAAAARAFLDAGPTSLLAATDCSGSAVEATSPTSRSKAARRKAARRLGTAIVAHQVKEIVALAACQAVEEVDDDVGADEVADDRLSAFASGMAFDLMPKALDEVAAQCCDDKWLSAPVSPALTGSMREAAGAKSGKAELECQMAESYRFDVTALVDL